MRLCLVEDNAVSRLEPLTLTRPVFDLRLGARTLGEKIARAFGVGRGPARRGVLIRPYLATVQAERDPHTHVNDADWLAKGRTIVANGRWVPPSGFEPDLQGGNWVGLCDGKPAFAWVEPDRAVGLRPANVDDWFDELVQSPNVELRDVGGEWVEWPWDLVARNSAHLIRDFEDDGRSTVSNRQLATAAIVGSPRRLQIHDTARIDPYTVFDTTNGPITIASGVVVQPFTRVEGPCYIGPNTQLFRANLRGGVTIGPECRIGGEVEETLIHGYSNKYHEGFLGHAYVGEWVNLGAITSNSDLRNDYGEVMVPLGGDPVPTGQAKVGCFIGDHSRTGMGSFLNTGTAVGVMCNVLPAGLLLPKHIPSFTAVLYGKVAPGFPIEQMFQTAETVTGRRGRAFTATERQLYLSLFEKTRLERERAFQRHQERRGDQWHVASSYRRESVAER